MTDHSTPPHAGATGPRLEVVGARRKTVRYLSALSPQMRALIVSELRGGREVVAVAQVYQVREVVVLELWLRAEVRELRKAA